MAAPIRAIRADAMEGHQARVKAQRGKGEGYQGGVGERRYGYDGGTQGAWYPISYLWPNSSGQARRDAALGPPTGRTTAK